MMANPARVLLLTNDLVCSSKVTAAGQQAGVPVVVAWNSEQLLEKAAEGVELVILDLTARLDVAVTVARLKALVEPPKTLAFGPHVHEAKLAGASAAGCDTILTRGQFHSQVDEILDALKSR